MIIIYIRRKCISGEIVVDAKTKELVKRLNTNQIAVVQHSHLDGVAAKDLIRQQPLAVINFGQSISNERPSKGANLLVTAGIMLVDVISNHLLFSNIKDGMKIELSLRHRVIKFPEISETASIRPLTTKIVSEHNKTAYQNYNNLYSKFLQNTLEHAVVEQNVFTQDFPDVQLQSNLRNKKVIIVTRGPDAYEDFLAIRPFILRENPVLLGVDGGADIIIKNGFIPDIIIGDMDSVSDQTLYLIGDRIIHSYPSGDTPGLIRLAKMNLEYQLLPFVGTSEDIAILLAFEQGAERIILIGSHNHMLDFLEKGRAGMASTLLTRMKVGHIIIDAKGIHSILNNLS